jgi:hypothetical protein
MTDLDHYIADTLQDQYGHTRSEAYDTAYQYTQTRDPLDVVKASSKDLAQAIQDALRQESITRHPSGKALTPAVPGQGANIVHFPTRSR